MIKHLSRYLGGTAIKRIIVRHLAKYEFPIPPLTEQIQIASILSGVDAVYSLLLYTKTHAMQTIFLRLWRVTTS